MQRIPMPAAVAAITILATGCIADDDQAHPTVTVTTGMASGQGLLLVTDAAGAWQPVAIVDSQASFVPATRAYGVAFACRYGSGPAIDMRSSTLFRTIDDGNELHFAGCNLSPPRTAVTVIGLEANQEFVANGTPFTAAQPTLEMEFFQPELMGVLWQVKPRAVLGFVRQAVLPAQTEMSLNAAAAVAPALVQVETDIATPNLVTGLTRYYSGETFYELDTIGAAEGGTIAVPPPEFRLPGDLMELDATELTSATNLRYVQRLVDTTDVFRPSLPAAWNAAAPQISQGGVSFSFSPRTSWEGWYTASLQLLGPAGFDLHHITVSSAWAAATDEVLVRSPDLSDFASWARVLTDDQPVSWWSDAISVSAPAIAAGREIYVARTFPAP